MNKSVIAAIILSTSCGAHAQMAASAPRPSLAPMAPAAPGGVQFYGSAEAGALSLQAFHALLAFVETRVAKRPSDSVVLAADAPLVKGAFVPCGSKPLAVIFDIDETMVRNLGFQARMAAGEAYDEARWSRWERGGAAAVEAMPGAGHATGDLRKMGVTVVFNSNRSAMNGAATAAMLDTLKLGPAVAGETLFLQGDVDGKAGKDGRRAVIAAKYCVVAMAGDQLGDFSDLFNEVAGVADRRAVAIHSRAAGEWGKGWFLIPNTIYGGALKGGIDDAFPADKRWADVEGAKN